MKGIITFLIAGLLGFLIVYYGAQWLGLMDPPVPMRSA